MAVIICAAMRSDVARVKWRTGDRRRRSDKFFDNNDMTTYSKASLVSIVPQIRMCGEWAEPLSFKAIITCNVLQCQLHNSLSFQ